MCLACSETTGHAESCPWAPCPYPGCDGTADGTSCRHPLPGDDDDDLEATLIDHGYTLTKGA